MARNSRSSKKQKKSSKKKPNMKSSIVTATPKVRTEQDHANPNMHDEPITPQQVMDMNEGKGPGPIQLSDWFQAIKGKHPISKLSHEGVLEGEENKEMEVKDNSERSPTGDNIQITMDDVQPELDYWQSSIVTFVLGANPLVSVMDGFVRRIWSKHGVDRVIGLQKGMFLIRFTTMEKRDMILGLERPFFDSKPLIMKPWTEDMDLSKETDKTIPIWIQVSVHFKYWGIRALEKIVKPIGRLIRLDATIIKRDKLQYARVMVEVLIDQYFPNSVTFMNEKGCQVQAPIGYEWKPTKCDKCKKFGHHETACYYSKEAPKTKKVWKTKDQSQAKEDSETTQTNYEENSHEIIQIEDQLQEGRPNPGNETKELENTKNGDPGIGKEGVALMSECRKFSLVECVWKDVDSLTFHMEVTFLHGQINKWEKIEFFSKIDRVMANEAWLETFSRFTATFLPESISDHCPALVRSINDDSEGKKPFKYYRMWREVERYKEKVRMAWEGNDQGTSMYKITRKLKRVKTCLKELNRLGFCTIQADAQQAYQQLILAQQQVHASPNDVGLAELEKEAFKNYKVKQKIYEQFLQQKAKCQWIREGDSNAALFHKSIKQRRLQNTIYAIRDCKGVLQDNPSSVAGAFLEYYKNLLGAQEIGRQKVQQEIVDLGL
ncbi:Gag polyprotein [Bienertia sinuspersici]